ncbi:Gfo/Idh/MocA family oxidoreductase [Actinoallomurus liliacearum]|uniref:Gfo/Idh/MocA family oxidoreductase n=1 Tax=Actinoallomurus liliacearum TaxID=1080073 RepID=A0ABP8TJT9_9ACTN
MEVTVGLAGADHRAAEAYAPSIAAHPDLVFAGVWAPSPQDARRLAERHAVRDFARHDDMVRECDAIVYALPPAAQAELALMALGHGRAVLLGRPIAGDLAGAERLAIAARTTGAPTQVALTWRYASAVREFLAQEVRRTRPRGGTGRCVAAPPMPALPAERGVLRTLGPDLIDLLDAALGRALAVHARVDSSGWTGLTLEHPGGRFSEAFLFPTDDAGSHRADAEVFGPGGVAELDCAAAVGRDAYDTMIAEFVEAIHDGRPHELDVRHGLHLQQVIEEADMKVLAGQ